MNIDNNLGMALFSKDLNGAAAVGDFQGMANSVSENPDGSPFQQLISQMLTEKNSQMTEASVDNQSGGKRAKAGGIGDLLSELLLSGGNLAMIRLQNEGNVLGDSAVNKVQSEQSVLTDESADALEAIQALMAGLTNAMPVSNTEKVMTEFQTGKVTAEASSAGIGSVRSGVSDLGMLDTQKYITSNLQTEIISEEMTVPANGKTTTQDGKLGQTEASSNLQTAGKLGQTDARFRGRLASISDENGLRSANEKSEAQKGISSQEFKISETGSGKQTGTAEIQTRESILDRTGKSETETDGASRDGISFQNTMQGAVTTSEVTEPSSLTQPASASEPYNQISEEILSKMDQKSSTEFRMQLEPEDLGQIDIKLKLSEGKLVIDILAANSRTQALLTNHVDKLIASMGLQNVLVESVQVSQQMNSQTQDNSQSQGYTMSSGMDFSQRRQQENLQQEILNGSKQTGTFNLQQDEAHNSDPLNRIESMQYNSHRMNYAV